MADERQYTIEQAMQALTAMRREAGLPEQLFPVQAFVGMVSDEIEALRAGGRSDEAIARLIEQNSAVRVSAEEIGRFYATPEERAGHGGEGGRG